VGPDWVIANVTRFRHAFPDLTVEIEEIVASRDLVAVRTRLRGTHLGTWKAVAATGLRVDYQEAAFWTFDPKTSLIRRGHFIADGLTLRIQLGLLPASAR
jgi:predicted ester cyclase